MLHTEICHMLAWKSVLHSLVVLSGFLWKKELNFWFHEILSCENYMTFKRARLTMGDLAFQRFPELSNTNKQLVSVSKWKAIPDKLLLWRQVIYLGFSLLPSVSVLQELIAVGLCNICSSFFKSFVVSCTISGTIIQEKTGGRTQVSWAGFVKFPNSHLKSQSNSNI